MVDRAKRGKRREGDYDSVAFFLRGLKPHDGTGQSIEKRATIAPFPGIPHPALLPEGEETPPLTGRARTTGPGIPYCRMTAHAGRKTTVRGERKTKEERKTTAARKTDWAKNCPWACRAAGRCNPGATKTDSARYPGGGWTTRGNWSSKTFPGWDPAGRRSATVRCGNPESGSVKCTARVSRNGTASTIRIGGFRCRIPPPREARPGALAS